jgi:hypothetical protein
MMNEQRKPYIPVRTVDERGKEVPADIIFQEDKRQDIQVLALLITLCESLPS